MFKNLLSVLLICSIILISNGFASAQTRGSWNEVKNLVNQSIAVKTRGGKTVYGVVRAADADGIRIELAEKKGVFANESSLARNEIEKIWRANLFINRRKTKQGALIGAIVGSAGMGGLAVAQGDDDGLAGAGFALGILPGALVGGTIGFFIKKKHQKLDLIFEK
jgi:hypothetical protein